MWNTVFRNILTRHNISFTKTILWCYELSLHFFLFSDVEKKAHPKFSMRVDWHRELTRAIGDNQKSWRITQANEHFHLCPRWENDNYHHVITVKNNLEKMRFCFENCKASYRRYLSNVSSTFEVRLKCISCSLPKSFVTPAPLGDDHKLDQLCGQLSTADERRPAVWCWSLMNGASLCRASGDVEAEYVSNGLVHTYH